MRTLFDRFKADETGATAIEYGLIAAILCVAWVAAMALYTPELGEAFGTVGSDLDEASQR